MRSMFLATLFLAGCPVSGDSGKGDTSDSEPVVDNCNTDNEDCTESTCRGEGGEMLPGSNCLACHKSGGGEAPPWTIGGTIFTDIDGTGGANKVTIRVTDADGTTREYQSNQVGNFYGNDNLNPPFTVEVELDGNIKSMGTSVETGACGSCHSCDGAAGGKLYAP